LLLPPPTDCAIIRFTSSQQASEQRHLQAIKKVKLNYDQDIGIESKRQPDTKNFDGTIKIVLRSFASLLPQAAAARLPTN